MWTFIKVVICPVTGLVVKGWRQFPHGGGNIARVKDEVLSGTTQRPPQR